MVGLYQNGAILQNEEEIMDVVINRYFIGGKSAETTRNGHNNAYTLYHRNG